MPRSRAVLVVRRSTWLNVMLLLAEAGAEVALIRFQNQLSPRESGLLDMYIVVLFEVLGS